jgi:hypothetical protein
VRLVFASHRGGFRGLGGDQQHAKSPYEAVSSCLGKLAEMASELGASVHMPRTGCGLAFESWELFEPIVADKLTANRIEVTVYDHS